LIGQTAGSSPSLIGQLRSEDPTPPSVHCGEQRTNGTRNDIGYPARLCDQQATRPNMFFAFSFTPYHIPRVYTIRTICSNVSRIRKMQWKLRTLHLAFIVPPSLLSCPLSPIAEEQVMTSITKCNHASQPQPWYTDTRLSTNSFINIGRIRRAFGSLIRHSNASFGFRIRLRSRSPTRRFWESVFMALAIFWTEGHWRSTGRPDVAWSSPCRD